MIKLSKPICPKPEALASKKYNDPVNKQALSNACFGKCMYCEAFVLDISYGEIEHIKPKNKFPKLEFDWDNLGFICRKCNNNKHNKYHNKLPYLDPYIEDPEDFVIAQGSMLVQKNGSERAEITILDLGLNRSDLIINRDEVLRKIQKTIDACYRTKEPLKSILLEQLSKEGEKDKEFSLFVKTRLKLESL